MTWTEDPAAADYVVYEDTDPQGPFATVAGTAASGAEGLTLPMPAGSLYYLVAGNNEECGQGPL